MRCKAGKFVFLVFASFLILTAGVSGAMAVGHDDIFNGNISEPQTHIIKGASPRIITVGHTPDADYWYIQDAINAAKDGDIIEVWSGIYYEHLVINKSLTIKSRDGAATTTINSMGSETAINITTDNVTISGFGIMNATEAGIKS